MTLFLLFLFSCFFWGLRVWKNTVQQQMWMVVGIVFLIIVIYYILPKYI